MDSGFNFKAAGYDSPGDWARLNDLLPELSKEEQAALGASGDSKATVLEILRKNGIQAPAIFDAEAVARRNT